ncbi:hypothetical protein DEU56DRAFT_755172 [Suillus clintonianus]|uniref:uncharacterized protein n=1 Tax=Suillus clintonianus TaxID=1904413 RepID=UPI001B8861B1|nr:uncharacterized protein DEU56DRAFT_755172 [Suillus clintonianus]KAG2140554.1 hypothetical protein DEU56DRAFT_755172 [Suillus clintonianus]
MEEQVEEQVEEEQVEEEQAGGIERGQKSFAITPSAMVLWDYAQEIIQDDMEHGETHPHAPHPSHPPIQMSHRDKCLLTLMVEDRREAYAELHMLHEWYHDVPVMALTATVNKSVIQDIRTWLGLHDPMCLVQSSNCPNLYYAVQPKPTTRKKAVPRRKNGKAAAARLS